MQEMRKRTIAAMFIACLTFLTSVYVPVLAGAEQKTIFFVENGKSVTYVTQARTVKDFFLEQGVELTPKDKSSKDYSELLEMGTKIELIRGFYVTAVIDGKEERLKVSGDSSVGAFIMQLKKDKKMNFTYIGSLVPILTEGQKVILTSYYEEYDIAKEPIPFETIEVETPDLLEGEEEIAQEGADGEREVVSKVTYEGGVEQAREPATNEVVLEPVDRIIKVGTGKPPEPEPEPTPEPEQEEAIEASAETSNQSSQSAATSETVNVAQVSSENIKYSKVITMSATAYTAGPESPGKRPGMKGYGITASGMRVAHGVVAVDPRVIRLGTRLYVEGYGYAIAADTGGAIKGNRIDLYMESLSAALRFGRRNVKVYVLE
jgi:3D (Asp-Asp-Asp) domain-containing protein/uncharacterized protein YabE (DUF348 family)